MYTLIIVDDEALARHALRTRILKNFSDIEIIGEAENGKQAIEMSRNLKPDIVVMDIKMPGINGIDASHAIINEFSDTKILMLTAYDNFNYIQQAMDIGVAGYLLKPLKSEDVINKINKVLKDIRSKRSQMDLSKEVEQKLGGIKPLIQKELISTLITGTTKSNEVKIYLEFLQEKIDIGYFMLISPEQKDSDNFSDLIKKNAYDKVVDVVKNHLPVMRQCIFGKSIGNIIIVLFPVEATCSNESIVKESIVISKEIKRKVKVIANLDIAIGIGNVHSDMQNIKQSYDEANSALRKAIKHNDIVHYNSISKDFDENIIKYPLKLENVFLEQLRMGNINKVKGLAEDIILHIFSSNFNIINIKEYVSELIIILKRNILQIGVEAQIVNNIGILLDINKIDKADELKMWTKNNIYTMIEYVGRLKTQKDSIIMRKIYEFVDKHFYKDITLEMVSEQVGFSTQYFSKFFKENHGINFVEYITDKRIRYAKELLKFRDKSIKEIGKQVGYEDVNYFSRIFKKNTGLTPKQYRDKVKVIGEI